MQFATIFHFLKQRHPMKDFKNTKELINFLKFLNIPCKHWNDNIGWNMVEVMHFFVLTSMRLVVQKVLFISVSFNGVTTINNQTWILKCVYIVKGWKWFPRTLQQVSQGSNAKNLMQIIIDALLVYNGLFEFDLIAKFVYFDVDGMTTFEGNKIDIKVYLKEKHAPFMFNLHCVAHRTNLVVQTLPQLSLVSKIESLLHLIYNDYAQTLNV